MVLTISHLLLLPVLLQIVQAVPISDVSQELFGAPSKDLRNQSFDFHAFDKLKKLLPISPGFSFHPDRHNVNDAEVLAAVKLLYKDALQQLQAATQDYNDLDTNPSTLVTTNSTTIFAPETTATPETTSISEITTAVSNEASTSSARTTTLISATLALPIPVTTNLNHTTFTTLNNAESTTPATTTVNLNETTSTALITPTTTSKQLKQQPLQQLQFIQLLQLQVLQQLQLLQIELLQQLRQSKSNTTSN